MSQEPKTVFRKWLICKLNVKDLFFFIHATDPWEGILDLTCIYYKISGKSSTREVKWRCHLPHPYTAKVVLLNKCHNVVGGKVWTVIWDMRAWHRYLKWGRRSKEWDQCRALTWNTWRIYEVGTHLHHSMQSMISFLWERCVSPSLWQHMKGHIPNCEDWLVLGWGMHYFNNTSLSLSLPKPPLPSTLQHGLEVPGTPHRLRTCRSLLCPFWLCEISNILQGPMKSHPTFQLNELSLQSFQTSI